MIQNPPTSARGKTLLSIVALIGSLLGCTLFIANLWQGRHNKQNPNGEYTELRGGAIFQIGTVPNENGITSEVITIKNDHTASRVIEFANGKRSYGEPIRIADPLWSKIDMLRQIWCAEPPLTHHLPDNHMDYQVVVGECHSLRSPILYFPLDKLDSALQAVVDATRSAATTTSMLHCAQHDHAEPSPRRYDSTTL